MASYQTNVKWGKQTVSLSLTPSLGVSHLKSQLASLTSVPPHRMKLMSKSKGLWKGILKDDADLTAFAYAEPISLLLMGSAEVVRSEGSKTVFLEDLPEEEKARVVEPSGLANLGNTCYLNSVVQCLRAVPALRAGLGHLEGEGVGKFLVGSLGDTLRALDSSSKAVSPSNLVAATKMAFPQMAQTGPGGRPMQQDAEEFYSQLLNAASQILRSSSLSAAFPNTNHMGATNLIDALFGIQMEQTLTCDESGATSPPTTDLARKLVCSIQGVNEANVTHVSEGIALSLTDKVERYSDAMGRNTVHTQHQRMSRLPSVICVQFARFYWKATPDSQDHSGVKCKVMKPVGFNSVLDVYEFCTDKVKEVLKVSRDKAAKEEEERVAKRLKGEDTAAEDAAVEEMDEDDELKAALAMSVEKDLEPVGVGLPSEFQGLYELFAVVTHKGRDADGGHYMGWVKASNGGAAAASPGEKQKIADTEEENEDWYVFDDDEVSPCKTEDILKLKGGGDWHMSYLNFYRAKK